jgi:transposase-like protein
MAKRFSEQFKQETVAYAMANKTKSTKELALTLGIGHSTLSKWLHRAGSSEPSQFIRHINSLKTGDTSVQIQRG